MSMRAIPIPIRRPILELYDRGRSAREIAQLSGFCVAAVRRVRQQFRLRATLEPWTHLCGRKTLLTEERKHRLHRPLSEQPDTTLAELGARLVFVDESGANTKMTRLRGRTWGGQRLWARIPHGR
jgi:transposase